MPRMVVALRLKPDKLIEIAATNDTGLNLRRRREINKNIRLISTMLNETPLQEECFGIYFNSPFVV
tara:strand:- start:312 stop:509 length:198 start_codon:yes stop_codon:yes gene_type:complete